MALLSFFRTRRSRPAQAKAPTRSPRPRRLTVEALEDRLLLSGPGDFDLTFNGSGEVLGTFSNGAHAIKIQDDGKILVGGQGNGFFALVRYNPNGSLDSSFSGGKVITGVSSSAACDYQLAIYPSSDPVNGGKILALGDLYIQGKGKGQITHYNLVRYNPDGTLDTSFGTGGFAMCPSSFQFSNGGNSGVLLQSVTQSDGSVAYDIIVAGNVSSNQLRTASYTAALVRFTPTGSLDSSFGSGGIVTTSIGSLGNSEFHSLAFETVGTQTELVAAGQTWNSNPYNREQFVVARYYLNGTLDPTFYDHTQPSPSQPGVVITDSPSGSGRAEAGAVVVQPADQKIVITGYIVNSMATHDIGLVRYNPDGSLDSTFGSGGIEDLPIAQSAFPYAMALQTDGKIVVSGDTRNSTNTSSVFGDITVARFNTYGMVDTSFVGSYSFVPGTNPPQATPGSVTIPSNGGDAYSVAIQSDGKIVTAGFYNYNTAQSWEILRFNGGSASPMIARGGNATSAGSSSIAGALLDSGPVNGFGHSIATPLSPNQGGEMGMPPWGLSSPAAIGEMSSNEERESGDNHAALLHDPAESHTAVDVVFGQGEMLLDPFAAG